MKILTATLVLMCASCAWLNPQTPVTPAPTPTPPAPRVTMDCQFTGASDQSTTIQQLKQFFIDQRNDGAGETLLIDTMNQMRCNVPAVRRITFSYANNGAFPGQPLQEKYCLTISILEDEEAQPHFQEWAACSPSGTSLEYLIDFNNILTENQPIDPSLRIAGLFATSGELKRFAAKQLAGNYSIADDEEFLYEAIMFDVDIPTEIVDHFSVIAAF